MAETLPTDELFWTAARYVWGELPADETAAFEERLAYDETACLAVAEATRLILHVQVAAPHHAVMRAAEVRPKRTQSRWAAAWLTVALLTVATAWFAVQQAAGPSKADPVSTELLARWTDAGELADGDLFDDLDAEPEVLDESLTAPSWLVQAVQLADDSRTSRP